MVHVLSDPALYAFTGGEPPSESELRARYERQARGLSPDGRAEWLNWIVFLDHKAIGYVQATISQEARAEIAWVIGTPWQGAGYASEAARALTGFLEQQGVRDIRATVHPDHTASERVAERAGLTRTQQERRGEVAWRRDVGSLDGSAAPDARHWPE